MLALSLGGLAWLAGCSSSYIPNTDVEDTEDNRKIIVFCETYRHAVENKDVTTLLGLAAEDYYEDGGNIDPQDDIDYAGLKEYLTARYKDVGFADAGGIRHEIRYRRVSEDENVVFVDYTFSGSFRVLRPDGSEKWEHRLEENRLELVPAGESYKIRSGM
jgi:hypothetical protein